MRISAPLLSFLSIIIPYLNVFYVGIKLNEFYSDKDNMNIFDDYCLTFLKNDFDWKKLTVKKMVIELSHAHYKRHSPSDIKKFISGYKKAFRTILIYIVLACASTVIWCLALWQCILHYQDSHLEFTSVLLLYGFGITWLFGLAPILNFFRLWGWLPEKINNFVYNTIASHGKLAMILPKVAIRLAILPVNAVVFGFYVFYSGVFLRQYLPDRFITYLLILGTYQYILCPFYAFISYHVSKRSQRKRGNEGFSFEYHHAVIKNNTYLLFLLIFIGIKSIQLSGFEAYGLKMAEAMGILFLFDTYLLQNKNIDALEENKKSKNKSY